MITDRDRGDPPRRLHIAPLLWAGAHTLVWSNPNVCFISATDDKGDDPPPSSEPGRRIPTKCAKCSVENEADAKFCKGCGASMATASADDDPPSSKEPPSS